MFGIRTRLTVVFAGLRATITSGPPGHDSTCCPGGRSLRHSRASPWLQRAAVAAARRTLSDPTPGRVPVTVVCTGPKPTTSEMANTGKCWPVVVVRGMPPKSGIVCSTPDEHIAQHGPEQSPSTIDRVTSAR